MRALADGLLITGTLIYACFWFYLFWPHLREWWKHRQDNRPTNNPTEGDDPCSTP